MTLFVPTSFSAFERFRPSRLAAFLRSRPDSEHELSFNRLFLTSTIVIYLALARHFGSTSAEGALAGAWQPVGAFGLASAALFAHLLAHPGVSHARRVIGQICDISIFSYGLYACDTAGSALFPIYFWIILGNGFRFDRRYLALAAVLSFAAFSVVATTTPFWAANPILDVGLLCGLLGIPAYASGLIRKLYEAKRQAEEASRAKSLFLASVSHELRTPLNAIIGLSDLLARSRLDDEQHHMSRVINQSGSVLLRLINSLLDFSRIEAGHGDAKSEPVDLALFLRDIREVVGVAAFAKGLRVALHVSPRTPRLIATDRRHLEEIFTNLAGNAVKFTAAGHVGIRVDAVPVGSALRLHIEVSDTGIGIAEEARARIFESFTQADGTIIDRFGGTGLGLAIVRQLVQLHGGEISVASIPGAGSTFTLDIEVGVVEGAATPKTECPPVVALTFAPLHVPGFPEAIVCSEIADARAALARLRVHGQRRPIVIVDTAVWYDRLEEVGRALIGDACADEPCLVLLSDGPEGEDLDPRLTDLYVTTITRDAPGPLTFAAAITTNAPEPTSASESSLETPVATAPGRTGLSILVAEDNKTNQMVIGKILERAGHHASIAENGEEAVERMLAEEFDLVLMDINMPVMNGIEATRFYRFAALGRRRIPILALTADATEEAERRCRDAGMDGCLTKPIEPDRLVATIAALTDRADAHPAVKEAPAREAASLEEQPIIDAGKLAELEHLGGADFVDELVSQFVDEAATILSSLSIAVAEDDVFAFRDRIHALRSGAANVGAARVYQMCLNWRATDARELALDGEIRLRALEDEFAHVRTAIEHRAT